MSEYLHLQLLLEQKKALRHDTLQNTSLDMEMGFIKDHLDVMRVETGLMKYIAATLEANNALELETLGVTLPKLPEGDIFPH